MATKKQSKTRFTALTVEPKQTDHLHAKAKEGGQTTAAAKLENKLFRVRPEAARQFDILKAELQKPGPELIAEALNRLFEAHGKPPVA